MPSSLPLNPVFVFIDESGNFDFSEKGTRHFVMSAFVTADPLSSGARLQRLRYELLATGVDIAHFHASHDKQFVRDRVLAEFQLLKNDSAVSFFVDKRELPERFRSRVSLYGLFARNLARKLVSLLQPQGSGQVVLVFDRVLTGGEINIFNAEVKPVLNFLNLSHQIYFHGVNFDYNGQIADYIAWANFVNLERSEERPLLALPENLSSGFELKIK